MAGIGLLILGVSAFILVLIGIGTSYRPPDLSTYQLIVGNNGLLGLAATFLTLIGAAVTVALLFVRADHDGRQLELARANARLSQFKEAAVLLANPHSSASLNGMHLMVELAREYPEKFQKPVRAALAASVGGDQSSLWDTLNDYYSDPKLPMPSKFPMSSRVTIESLGAIGELRPPHTLEWIGTFSPNGAYIGGITLSGGNLSGTQFKSMFSHDVIFKGQQLVGAHLDLCITGYLAIIGCNLEGASLRIEDLELREDHNRTSASLLAISNCNLRGAMLNGIPFPDVRDFWQGDEARRITIWDYESLAFVQRP